MYAIDCDNCDKKYCDETKRRLTTREKGHKEEVENMMAGRTFTRGTGQHSETETWRSAITDHACQTNHVICWDRAKMANKEAN